MSDRLFELEIRKIINEHRLLDAEEEWKNELIDSNKEKFMRDISHARPADSENEEESIEEPAQESAEEEKDSKIQMSDNIKKLFREIVKLTHPDKTMRSGNRKELGEMYIRAKTAAEELDICELLLICDELHIKWTVDISEKKILEENLEAKRRRLKAIESSYIWLWIGAATEEEKSRIVAMFIEKNK